MRRGGGGTGDGEPPATLSLAVLALVMCLLVVGVAGVVLRDALRDGTAKRATVRPRAGRARPRRPVRPRGHHPVRSTAALVVSSVGIGLLLAVVGALAAGALQSAFLFALAGTIYGGTSEVQRNIIAERVLGLPK